MNEAEESAMKWLAESGFTGLKFRSKDTPDFVSDQGGFEVKKIQGETIHFQGEQLAKIVESKAKVVVIGGLHPILLSVCDLLSLECSFRVPVESSVVRLSDGVYFELKALQERLAVNSLDEVINILLTIRKTAEMRATK